MATTAPVKILSTDITRRLELYEWKFNVFTAATGEEVDGLQTAHFALDQEFQYDRSDKISAKDIPSDLARFILHCCKLTHYFFDILKCGNSNCTLLCLPVRLHLLSLKNWIIEVHYKPFSGVFKAKNTEEHQPQKCAKPQKEQSLSFYASVHHVRNVEIMLMCDEF